MIDKLKKLFYEIKKGQDKYKIDKKVAVKWFGNEHAGFYVSESHLSPDGVILSFGVGTDISFDKSLRQLAPYSKIYLFDPTPKSINFIENQDLDDLYQFHPFGLDQNTGSRTFLLPKNDSYVSGSTHSLNNVDETKSIEVQMKTFSDIISELKIEKVDLLKMDIEGSEYDVIDGIIESNIHINQICIEFHTRYFEDGKKRTKEGIEKLKKAGYLLVKYSYNAEEFTFIKGGK